MISDSGAVRVPFLSSKNVFTGHAPAAIISPSAMGTSMMISPSVGSVSYTHLTLPTKRVV